MKFYPRSDLSKKLEGAPLTLLRYALAEVFRGRRRTISAVVGVAIAVSFLAGTSLAIDSSVSIAMGSYLSRLDRDFTIFAQTAQARQLADNLSAVPGVTFVAPYRQIAAGSEFSTGNLTGGLPYAVDPNRLPPFLATWHLSGTMVLARGSTVVSGDLAARFVVGIGDTIELRASTFNVTSRVTETRFVNLTVQGLLDAPTNGVSLINGPSFSSFLLIHLDDADWLDSVLTSRVTPRTSVDVLIDRGALLNAYDIEGSRRNLARLQRGLATVAHSYNGSVGDMVSSILGYVETFSGLARQLFFALSMPIIFLGLYVGAIGVDLAHSERRRHLSILKARGANSRQILELLILESLITGSLAAGVGLIAGLGISRVLVGSVSGFFASTPAPTEIVVAPITIILTLLFGTLFMFIISYRSAKRTAGIAAVETLRFYIASETRLNYRPTLDIFFLAVGVGAFGLFLAHGAGVGVVSFFGGPVAFVLLPIAPFLIAVGLIRLATRASPRVYEWVSTATAPFTKALAKIVARNLARNPRRAASIAVILALGLAFGMMSLSMHDGSVAWEDRKVRADIGADLSVIPPSGNLSFADAVSSVPGVVGVAAVKRVPVEYPNPCGSGLGIPLCLDAFALDSDYFSVANPDPWYFVDGIGAGTREVLSTVGSVLATEHYLRDSGHDVGDRVTLNYTVLNQTSQSEETRNLNVTIGGVVRGLPGVTARDRLPWEQQWQVYGSLETFRSVFQGISNRSPGETRLLVDLEDRADWQATKRAILDRGALDVRAYEEERGGANTSPVGRSFLGFLRLQSFFLIGVLVTGLVLVTIAASLERLVEFAGITARGASGWQTATILLGEAMSIVVIGTSVGVVAGLLVAYVGATIVPAGPGGEAFEPLAPFPFIVPLDTVLFIAAATGALFIASVLVSWRIARMDVARVLRQRAG